MSQSPVPFPHWSSLPTKAVLAASGVRVRLPRRTWRVGRHWNPKTGVLAVDGLTDVSNTEGQTFLATPVAQLEPPVLRLYLADEPHPWGGRWFFALLPDDDGELVLASMRERDLDHPANHTGFWP